MAKSPLLRNEDAGNRAGESGYNPSSIFHTPIKRFPPQFLIQPIKKTLAAASKASSILIQRQREIPILQNPVTSPTQSSSSISGQGNISCGRDLKREQRREHSPTIANQQFSIGQQQERLSIYASPQRKSSLLQISRGRDTAATSNRPSKSSIEHSPTEWSSKRPRFQASVFSFIGLIT